MGSSWKREMHGGPLTLEKYHCFFADPWVARITIDHLNHILSMHGFVRLHRYHKKRIMNHLVGQVDLQPPRRSTLHTGARLSAANIVAAQAAADVDAIGWTECPVGSVAVFAGFGEAPPEPLEPMPPPADHVLALALAVRRARSKRTRGSAYPRRVAPEKADVKEEHVELEEEEVWQPPPSPPPMSMRSPTAPPAPEKANAKEEDMELEEGEVWQPAPSPPPMWMRSPTPPPPPGSPPRPQTVVPPPPSSPGFSSPPPPGFGSPPRPGFGSARRRHQASARLRHRAGAGLHWRLCPLHHQASAHHHHRAGAGLRWSRCSLPHHQVSVRPR